MILEMERNGVALPEVALADAYVIHKGEGSSRMAVRLAGELRAAGVATVMGEGERSFKAQMRAANAAGARVALILGENEVASGTAVVKDLAGDADQAEVATDSVAAAVQQLLHP